MRSPSIPSDEKHRLEELYSLGLLDTLPEPRFDRLTHLACCVAKVPTAVISFVDAYRQWFKSRQGFKVCETSRDISFCGHAILQGEPLIVPDVIKDPRFADNPLVTGAPYVRFYAGYPIHAPGGARVGTLAVIDSRPRTLSSREFSALATLATMVDAELLTLRFNIATRAAGIGVHERHASGGDMWWSEAMWEIYGQDPTQFRPSFEKWLELVHPEDREYVSANAGGPSGERTAPGLQYRIVRPDGTIRHVQSLASNTELLNGSVDHIAGITLDVTARVASEVREHGQQQQLRESSHLAGMAEVATGVLHSVGNVVNSLGIANSTARRDLNGLRLGRLKQAVTLIRDNRATLADFLTGDERGRHLADYLPMLSAQIAANVQAIQAELDTTDRLLEHLREIVSAQQIRAHVGCLREPVDLRELSDATLLNQAAKLSRIDVVRDYGELPLVITDRHKMLLILVNLINNARDAVMASATQTGRIEIRLEREGDHAVVIVEDTGVGMSEDVLSRLWRYGFTTKPNGRGFDLHNSANAAREIGATITAHSEGPHKGARFTVRLPL